MSAGEFFDLVRPVFLVISALLSTLILYNARRNGFRLISALVWAIATLLLPFVSIPLYLFVRINRRKHDSAVPAVKWRILLPLLYLLGVLTFLAISQYRDYYRVDSYLARATQAKLRGDRELAIKDYTEALTLEDNPHIHKLLGIELNAEGDWTGALSEFRLAERGGEPDETLPFRIAVLLDSLNQPNQATFEFKRFLFSSACLKETMDQRCEEAKKKSNRPISVR